MGQAKELSLRLKVIDERNSGKSMLSISSQYNLAYNCVRQWCSRHQEKGLSGLNNNYMHCGPKKPGSDPLIVRASCWLKYKHSEWGAEYIRTVLKDRYTDRKIPGVRSFHNWFKERKLVPLKNRLPREPTVWSKLPHDTWQTDAKEQVKLGDGSCACWLTITDEKTSAVLDALLFPPKPDLSSPFGNDYKSTDYDI